MRVVFMGTPQLAATVLEILSEHHQVVAAYTRPDAVRGRGSKLSASPVKKTALHLRIPVETPETLRDADAVEKLKAYAPDVICVAAYGMILPDDVIGAAPFGCLNVHGSLLPRWRGAAPIERSILAGDERTGVCIMRVVSKLDAGDWCVRRTTSVAGKSADELTGELARMGGEALCEALDQAQAGTILWTPQDESGCTYARKIEKGELDLAPADNIAAAHRKVLASDGQHPSHVVIADRPVSVIETKLPDERAWELAGACLPGEVRFCAKRLFIGCGDGPLEVVRVKPNGKKDMDAAAFAAGIQGIKKNTKKWGSR